MTAQVRIEFGHVVPKSQLSGQPRRAVLLHMDRSKVAHNAQGPAVGDESVAGASGLRTVTDGAAVGVKLLPARDAPQDAG